MSSHTHAQTESSIWVFHTGACFCLVQSSKKPTHSDYATMMVMMMMMMMNIKKENTKFVDETIIWCFFSGAKKNHLIFLSG